MPSTSVCNYFWRKLKSWFPKASLTFGCDNVRNSFPLLLCTASAFISASTVARKHVFTRPRSARFAETSPIFTEYGFKTQPTTNIYPTNLLRKFARTIFEPANQKTAKRRRTRWTTLALFSCFYGSRGLILYQKTTTTTTKKWREMYEIILRDAQKVSIWSLQFNFPK